MTTKDMDAILEVAQTHNFNRAAENLFMAQSTLSYHIKAAEDELGFAIFVRSGKGAALTPAGEQFCVTLRNVRQELKNAVEQAQNFSARYAENISKSGMLKQIKYTFLGLTNVLSGGSLTYSLEKRCWKATTEYP